MSLQIDSTTYRSPNFNSRPTGMAISALVIHTTEGSWDSDAEWMCNPTTEVSTHYVIAPDGAIYRLVDESKRAWHAGNSSYNGRSNWNDFSIGIEISHRQGQSYGSNQLPAITDLSRYLVQKYAIHRLSVVTHRQVATPPGRKIDPTDWSDADFAKWADSLYVTDPLRARQIAGPPGQAAYYCSEGAYTCYMSGGGFTVYGYARRDEYKTTGQNGQPCSVFPCERAVFKDGRELALLGEAKAMGWIV